MADMERAWRDMNDYVRIKIRDPFSGEKIRLTPQNTSDFHLASRRFIEAELARKFNGYTIILTHHAPSGQSLPSFRQEDPHAAAYASSLEDLIEAFQPHLWAHGHVHSSADYTIGSTRVVCNPRGYVPDYSNRAFNSELVVELK
ncbi:hypothetical protein ACFPL7_13955 [Dongia soli]|uniref:hypothetical protein n=1 Tax=Dongia soli TaxID=600628 RepID=UPI0036162C6F